MSQDPVVKGAKIALILLLAINLFNYIDRQILASVVSDIKLELLSNPDQPGFVGFLMRTLGGILHSTPDNTLVSLLNTAFLASYVIVAPLLSSISVKRWWIIGGGIAVWSLASGGSGLAMTFGGLLLTRALVGVGEAAYGPVAPSILSDYYPVEKRGSALSMFYLAIPVGSALGFVLGGWIGSHFGWRYAFYAVVPPGIILAALCLFMRDPGSMLGAARKSDEKKAQSPVEKLGRFALYKRFLANPSYLYNTLAMTAMTFAIGGIGFWIPTYFHEFRQAGSLETVNITFGVVLSVAGLLGTLSGGFLADKLRGKLKGSYFKVSGIAMLFCFPFSLGMLYAPFPLAWVFVFLAGFCLFFNTGPSNTALANVIEPQFRPAAFALNILIIHVLGDVLSPLVIGVITDATGKNMTLAFLVVSVMVLIGGILWMIGARHLDADTARVNEQK